jgi:hypothetical protein
MIDEKIYNCIYNYNLLRVGQVLFMGIIIDAYVLVEYTSHGYTF